MSYVTDYIDLYEQGKVKFNKERIQLVDYVKENILNNDELYFDEVKIDQCVRFSARNFFPLEPFQKFLVSFVFLYRKEDDSAFYQNYLWMMGRGAGKNGLISALSAFLMSGFHGVPMYNGSIVANNEDQAKTSVKEVGRAIDNNVGMDRFFKVTKEVITSRETGSELTYRTSNPKTKDGLRDGFVIFDEIHMYPDDTGIQVYLSGLGKAQPPRVFYIGSDGYVRDGLLDKKKKLAADVLSGKASPDAIFPWICKIDSREEAVDTDNWEKANPMFSKPRSIYAKGLFRTVKTQYDELIDDPSGTEEFFTKRMDVPSESMTANVAPYEEIKDTNQPIPDDIDGREAIGAVDFAMVRDFLAAAVTIKYPTVDEDGRPLVKLITLEHQWATKWFCDKYYGYSRRGDDAVANARIRVPIHDWEDAGLLTVIRQDTMDPQLALDWMNQMAARFTIKAVVMDNFKATLLRQPFELAGYEVQTLRNPRSLDPLLSTIIDDGFPKRRFIWGDNPLLRWNTQNVLVNIDKTGAKHYDKKETIRRKTDGFQAFEYTLYLLDKISDVNLSGMLDMFSGLNL